jgi:hypothetical protein
MVGSYRKQFMRAGSKERKRERERAETQIIEENMNL